MIYLLEIWCKKNKEYCSCYAYKNEDEAIAYVTSQFDGKYKVIVFPEGCKIYYQKKNYYRITPIELKGGE